VLLRPLRTSLDGVSLLYVFELKSETSPDTEIWYAPILHPVVNRSPGYSEIFGHFIHGDRTRNNTLSSDRKRVLRWHKFLPFIRIRYQSLNCQINILHTIAYGFISHSDRLQQTFRGP
jgi:hypothetical protein